MSNTFTMVVMVVAYHHISGEYIALFSHFISCGVWEAVYIPDALLLNKSDYQLDTLHTDTHGQSEPVWPWPTCWA